MEGRWKLVGSGWELVESREEKQEGGRGGAFVGSARVRALERGRALVQEKIVVRAVIADRS